jgi:hypothetical protein
VERRLGEDGIGVGAGEKLAAEDEHADDEDNGHGSHHERAGGVHEPGGETGVGGGYERSGGCLVSGEEPGAGRLDGGPVLALGCFVGVAYLAEEGGAQVGFGLEGGRLGEEGRHLDVLQHDVGAVFTGEDVRFDTRSLFVRDFIVDEPGNQDLYFFTVTGGTVHSQV